MERCDSAFLNDWLAPPLDPAVSEVELDHAQARAREVFGNPVCRGSLAFRFWMWVCTFFLRVLVRMVFP